MGSSAALCRQQLSTIWFLISQGWVILEILDRAGPDPGLTARPLRFTICTVR
jgi:hypothetical protein